jgi:hypothetical protein
MKTRGLVLCSLLAAFAVGGLLLVLSRDSQVMAEWDGNWYWKDGNWVDYAPSGVPDFDQRQAGWVFPGTLISTHCGPVAVANSLWWFDSKFEPNPAPLPGPHNDNYFLVTSYGGWPPLWDDHDPVNVTGTVAVSGLVDHLACYLDTNVGLYGTEVHSMSYGLQQYLYNDPTHPCYIPGRSNGGSYYDEYHVQLVRMPTWDWVVEEVLRSEDVILLLGFWQNQGEWRRIGGHFATVAGVNPTDLEIAFSDPFHDNAEHGQPGRVLSGMLIPHVIPHGAAVHNDAGNVSHDAYPVILAPPLPLPAWEILNYPYVLGDFQSQNVPRELVPYQREPIGVPVHTVVEYALATSPFHWKPGGEWVHSYDGGEWIWEWWWYEDDGHSCLPDFAWGGGEPWYDGPTALANSLWWFDSKAETLKMGGKPVSPPTVSDHYGLVTPYGTWDDHAVTNTMLFIEDLAGHLLTTDYGTTGENMAIGIDVYLSARGVADDFYTHQQDAPTFEWVADEVETCEDVIVLLGFWETVDGVTWERKGGHWVNAAGVNRESGLIALSDPEIDWANVESFFDVVYAGRVFPPEHLGTPFTVDEKRDPQAISHDIYSTTVSPMPEYGWALADYPATSIITDFEGLNGGGFAWQGTPISTVVEWAIGVSPHSDLVVTKTALVTEAIPGEPITYLIEYANTGLAAVDHVTITEDLPSALLKGINYDASPPIHASPGVTYVWTLPRLSYAQQGVITVSATSVVSWVPTNTVYITGLSAIGGPTPDRDPTNNAANYVTYGVDLTPDLSDASGDNGAAVVHTFSVQNTGNVPDSFALSVANDDWPTTVAPLTVGPLNPSDSAAVQVTVTVPASATGATYDVASVTAQSVASATVSDTSVLTTEATVNYAVHQDPANAGLTGNQGQTMTYVLTIHNDGNITDTYDVTHTLGSWTTWLSGASVGPVGSGGSMSFTLGVGIPEDASDGDFDVVTVTATSQVSLTVSDASVLTTTATTRPIAYGVTVEPGSATGDGDPGEAITYTLQVTNAGNVADTFSLGYAAPSTWMVSLSSAVLSLGAGAGADVEVYVGIPSGAVAGSSGVVTVTVTSQASPLATGSAVLTTRVSWRFVYLPLVLRNYP